MSVNNALVKRCMIGNDSLFSPKYHQLSYARSNGKLNYHWLSYRIWASSKWMIVDDNARASTIIEYHWLSWAVWPRLKAILDFDLLHVFDLIGATAFVQGCMYPIKSSREVLGVYLSGFGACTYDLITDSLV